MQQAPGRTLLKVTGIILIVFGAIAALGAILILVAGGLLAGNPGLEQYASILAGGFAAAAGVVMLISAAANIAVGAIGVKHCNNLEKAQTCFILGIVITALQLVGLFINGFDFSGLLGLALPVLYLLGAIKNRQAYAATKAQPPENNAGGDRF